MAERKSKKPAGSSKKVEKKKPKKVEKTKAKPTKAVKEKPEVKPKKKPKEAKPKEPEKKEARGAKPKEKKPEKKRPEDEPKKEEKHPEERPKSEEEKPSEEKPEKIKEKKPKKVEKIKFYKPRSIEESQLLKKRPKFIRQELHIRKRLKNKWRRPRGIDSKKHEGKRGKGKLPKIGYKKPKKVSSLSSGFVPVMVHTTKDLDNVNPKKDAAIISARVGRKKRNMIITKANTLGITILNPRRGEL